VRAAEGAIAQNGGLFCGVFAAGRLHEIFASGLLPLISSVIQLPAGCLKILRAMRESIAAHESTILNYRAVGLSLAVLRLMHQRFVACFARRCKRNS